jgi:transposase-like protein
MWRLRYKLGVRDVAELLLQRGFEVTQRYRQKLVTSG